MQATQKCLNEPAEALLARWKSGPQRRVVGETLSREGCPSGSVGYRAREYQVDQGEVVRAARKAAPVAMDMVQRSWGRRVGTRIIATVPRIVHYESVKRTRP